MIISQNILVTAAGPYKNSDYSNYLLIRVGSSHFPTNETFASNDLKIKSTNVFIDIKMTTRF